MMKNFSESQILELASYTGKMILQNGGEVYRTEDVIGRVGKHFGYEVDAFVTLTCIVVSIKGADGKYYSQVTRIKGRDLNLNKIHKFNNAIRHIDEYTYEEFFQKLKYIEKNFYLEFYRFVFGCTVIGATFPVMFNTWVNEIIIGGIGGFIVGIFLSFLNKYKVNSVITNILGGMICSSIACFATYMGYTEHTSVIIISDLMIFVPGIAFVNTIRDLTSGDLIAGTSRFTEVIMVAASLAVGTGIVLKIFMSLGGVVY